MLQLAVLIAMPSPHNSPKKDPILEKLDPDPDKDEKESDDVLPEMVFGVTRVNYRQPSSPTLPPQPRPTWCGSVLNSLSFRHLRCIVVVRSPHGARVPLYGLWQVQIHPF